MEDHCIVIVYHSTNKSMNQELDGVQDVTHNNIIKMTKWWMANIILTSLLMVSDLMKQSG